MNKVPIEQRRSRSDPKIRMIINDRVCEECGCPCMRTYKGELNISIGINNTLKNTSPEYANQNVKKLYDDLDKVLEDEFPHATIRHQHFGRVNEEWEKKIRSTDRRSTQRFIIQSEVIDEITKRNPESKTGFTWGPEQQRRKDDTVHPNNNFNRRMLQSVYNL